MIVSILGVAFIFYNWGFESGKKTYIPQFFVEMPSDAEVIPYPSPIGHIVTLSNLATSTIEFIALFDSNRENREFYDNFVCKNDYKDYIKSLYNTSGIGNKLAGIKPAKEIMDKIISDCSDVIQ